MLLTLASEVRVLRLLGLLILVAVLVVVVLLLWVRVLPGVTWQLLELQRRELPHLESDPSSPPLPCVAWLSL